MLAAEDLSLPGLPARIADSKIPVLSANVYQDGKRIAAPFVVCGKTAIIGLTNRPSAMAGELPFEVRDPAQALAEVLPQVKAERIIVATSLSALEAKDLRAPVILCRPSGASSRESIRRAGWIVSIGPSSAALTVIRGLDDPKLEAVPVTAARDEKILKIFKEYGLLPEPRCACGALIDPADKFCGACGAKLK